MIKMKQMKNKKKKKKKKKKEKIQNQNNVRDELKKRYTCKNKIYDHEELYYVEKIRSNIKYFHIVDRYLNQWIIDIIVNRIDFAKFTNIVKRQ